jgi:hypothetical protein
MRQADAKVHSVAINPADLLKTRATGEGLAWAEAASAAAEEEAVAGAVVAAEVAEEGVADAAEAAGDDASWDSDRSRGSFAIGRG